MSIHLHTNSGSFHATTPELSSCNRCLNYRIWNVHWVFIEKVFKPSIINHKGNKLLIRNNLLSTLTKQNRKTTVTQVTSFLHTASHKMGFPVAQLVKNLPAMRETWVWSLGQEDALGKGLATRSSIFAWRIPMDRGSWQTRQSIGSQRVGHHWAITHFLHFHFA